MKRKTVVRNAALLSALLLLAGVLVPLAHAAVITTGVLSTGSHRVFVDSLDVMDIGGGNWRYRTAGAWGGDSLVVDTFALTPPMGFLPQLVLTWGTVDGSPFTLPIPGIVPDTWYIINGTPTAAQVMFSWHDTTITGIHERGPLGQTRVGLTVSPSVVGASATIRAERVAGTSCAFVFFDAAGNRVRTLRTQASPAGAASATWTGEDDLGHRLPEGIYYCCLDGVANPSVRKLILSR